jgi:phage tail sheath protein FI
MPVPLSYPGVYIEEIPGGVRTITGVATSITAFLGRAPRGQANEPITVNSFGDFERAFGGLSSNYPMSYAVRDFFLNGGSTGLIVRLQKGATAADIPLPTGGAAGNDVLPLVAASEGIWGNNLTVTVDYKTKDTSNTKLFNLTVTELDPITKQTLKIERSLNLSIDSNDPRYVPRTIEGESELVRVKKDAQKNWIVPNVRPQETDPKHPATASNGTDGVGLGDGDYTGSNDLKTGMFALEKADLFNLLCIPPDKRASDTTPAVYQAAMAYCATRRAMLIVDSPASWSANKETAAATARDHLSDLGLSGTDARNAALFFPRVLESDSLSNGQTDVFVPCGIVTGIMARTDTARGVWKAPAGLDAALNGIQGIQVNLTDPENGMLNPLGINCLRDFKINGRVVWGARTLRGADQLADEYKYIPVRRTALYIEESLYRGTQWVVFDPNAEPLWAQIRLNVGAFMHDLFRQGAFQGQTPKDAYFVKCDKETTTQNDINLGIVNIVVGFAPLKPAEFVVIKIQQIAGEIVV